MKAVIVSGGTPPPYNMLIDELDSNSILICADSGANCLYEYKVFPDYLIGDFDSVNPEVLKFFKKSVEKIEKFPKEKDFTDTELALNKAAALKAAEIVFLGCTGYRIDHTLGNLGLLRRCLQLNIKACIKDAYNKITIHDEPVILHGRKGEYFSLHSCSSVVEKLTIEGAKYSLRNYDLHLGDPLTISNEFYNNEVYIKFQSGILFVIQSND